MKLEDLITDLKKQATHELNCLNYGMENQIHDMTQTFRLEQMHLDEELENELTKETNIMKKELIEKTKLECRKNILKEKKKIINLAIEKGIKKLMTTKKYEQFLKKTIASEKNYNKIYGNKDDTILKKLTKNKYVKTDIVGGIIIEKNNITINKSLETILKKDPSFEYKLQNTLFIGD